MTDKLNDKLGKGEAYWKEKLSDHEFEVTRKKGTERAFTGEYYNCKDKGVYLCSNCGEELFSSETKYDSGSGWPSFWKPVSQEKIEENKDSSHGMVRTEVMCNKCGAHLGHVFEDGPQPTNQRYCINSVSLKLDKKGG